MPKDIFSPVTIGQMDLQNRVVMAPLTRNRADNDSGEVGDMHVEYYRQRAGAGLIITEASQISPEGKGYLMTPGIHTEGQVAAWKKVTDAVHEAGGKIVIQLWHVGRISHTSLQPGGGAPVAPSAITAEAKTFTAEGFVDTSAPRALSEGEIARVIEDYAHAVRMSRKAGFDGVEIHAANGYLLDQFMKTGANQRSDRYGGSVENRARLVIEVMEAAIAAWDKDHVGVRLSPFSNVNGVSDANPQETFEYVIKALDAMEPLYIHMIEGQTGGTRALNPGEDLAALRALYRGPYMANNGYDRQMALDAVASGAADLVAIGRSFIANPDLVERLRRDAPLNEMDADRLYGGGREGYIDYPLLES